MTAAVDRQGDHDIRNDVDGLSRKHPALLITSSSDASDFPPSNEGAKQEALRSSRRTIAIDEWAGYALLAALRIFRGDDPLFWIALVFHLAVTYGVSYPELWRATERADPSALTPLRWVRALWGRG